MERPAPNASKLLEAWMEWERGETPPGRVMSNLKMGGLRDLLEQVAADAPDPTPAEAGADAPAPAEADAGAGAGGEEPGPAAEAWKPVV